MVDRGQVRRALVVLGTGPPDLEMKSPSASKATVSGAGHLVNLEAQAEFNRLLLEFLRVP